MQPARLAGNRRGERLVLGNLLPGVILGFRSQSQGRRVAKGAELLPEKCMTPFPGGHLGRRPICAQLFAH